MTDPVYILYVEDNEGDVELLTMAIDRYFPSLNIVLDVAETVQEAIDKFQHCKHAIALLDWNLPDGEGLDVATFIREQQSDFPIFILSGVITDEVRDKAAPYNPIACLEKDYSKGFFQGIEVCILSLVKTG